MLSHFKLALLLVVCLIVTQNSLAQQTAPATEQIHKGSVGEVHNPPTAAARAMQAPIPTVPAWYAEMNQQQHSYIAQLLDYWQTSSDKVQQYKCDFRRYDYDTGIVNWRDPNTNQLAAAAIMQGEIRFAAPDKACYQTTIVHDFDLNEGTGKPDYKQREDKTTNREKWICDGKAIYEYDHVERRLYETEIPPEMQGKGLVNSPIPFLFGASRDDILGRYWVRVVTPNGVEDEYWLEAVPKKREDRQTYSKIELVLSRDDFLPTMLHIYAPNYDPSKNNFTSRVFEFHNRKVNSGLAKIQDFLNNFVRPSTPIGWKRVARKGLQQPQQFDRSALERTVPAQDASQRK